jgi:hypothetical protein
MDVLSGAVPAIAGVGHLIAAAATGGFFDTFLRDMKELMNAKDYLGILLDWRILIGVGLLGAFGLYSKSKGVLLFIFAMYGLTATFHFSMGGQAGMGDEMTGNVDNIVVFIVGLGAVAITIIYFVFIRGD